VVDPIFFPGVNIGDLSINGTVNDIAMCSATLLFISAGLIVEEGFFLGGSKDNSSRDEHRCRSSQKDTFYRFYLTGLAQDYHYTERLI